MFIGRITRCRYHHVSCSLRGRACRLWVRLAAGSRYVAGAGVALCIIGFVSFGIEGSHWLVAHNLSWIASFPVVMFPLAVVAGFQYRHRLSELLVAISES